MPLTAKGEKILGSMEKTYGSEKKAESVLYASKNVGKITGIDRADADTYESKLDAAASRADALGKRLDSMERRDSGSRLDREMSSHELINRAHAQGKRAKDAGRKKDDNPFSVGIPEHHAWEKGRSDADESYWTYKAATPTPSHSEATKAGAFRGSDDDWHSFSPGMRREIMRSHLKAEAKKSGA